MDMPWKKGTSCNKMSFSTSVNAFACCAVFPFAFAASFYLHRPQLQSSLLCARPRLDPPAPNSAASAISASDTGSADVLNSASAAAARVRCQASFVSLKSMRMAVQARHRDVPGLLRKRQQRRGRLGTIPARIAAQPRRPSVVRSTIRGPRWRWPAPPAANCAASVRWF